MTIQQLPSLPIGSALVWPVVVFRRQAPSRSIIATFVLYLLMFGGGCLGVTPSFAAGYVRPFFSDAEELFRIAPDIKVAIDQFRPRLRRGDPYARGLMIVDLMQFAKRKVEESRIPAVAENRKKYVNAFRSLYNEEIAHFFPSAYAYVHEESRGQRDHPERGMAAAKPAAGSQPVRERTGNEAAERAAVAAEERAVAEARAAEESARAAMEARQVAEARAAEERARSEAEARLVADAKAAEQNARAAAESRRMAEARAVEERKKTEEEARKAASAKAAEENARAAAEVRRIAEARAVEERKKAEEEARKAASAKAAEEATRAAVEARRLEDARAAARTQPERVAEAPPVVQREMRTYEQDQPASSPAARPAGNSGGAPRASAFSTAGRELTDDEIRRAITNCQTAVMARWPLVSSSRLTSVMLNGRNAESYTTRITELTTVGMGYWISGSRRQQERQGLSGHQDFECGVDDRGQVTNVGTTIY